MPQIPCSCSRIFLHDSQKRTPPQQLRGLFCGGTAGASSRRPLAASVSGAETFVVNLHPPVVKALLGALEAILEPVSKIMFSGTSFLRTVQTRCKTGSYSAAGEAGHFLFPDAIQICRKQSGEHTEEYGISVS